MELSKEGHEQAVALIESFKDKLKEAADLAIRDLYCDILPFIEGDAWTNFKNHMLDRLQDYPSLCKFDAERVRKAILTKHKDKILDDVLKDLIKENEQLKARNQELLDQLSRR